MKFSIFLTTLFLSLSAFSAWDLDGVYQGRYYKHGVVSNPDSGNCELHISGASSGRVTLRFIKDGIFSSIDEHFSDVKTVLRDDKKTLLSFTTRVYGDDAVAITVFFNEKSGRPVDVHLYNVRLFQRRTDVCLLNGRRQR